MRHVQLRLPTPGPKGQALMALALYGLAVIGLLGLPVLSRFSSAYLGRGGSDQNLFAWSVAWWPHAILNGQNPFHADVLWAPEGVNLAWVTAVPGPSLIASPTTSTWGPVASLNLLLLASPILAGWATYLVCRRITGACWPSVAGGYLFGFSAYVVAKTQGHLNLALVFLVPLALYVVLRRLDGSVGRLPFVLLLTGILVGQFSISTEVFRHDDGVRGDRARQRVRGSARARPASSSFASRRRRRGGRVERFALHVWGSAPWPSAACSCTRSLRRQ